MRDTDDDWAPGALLYTVVAVLVAALLLAAYALYRSFGG